MFILCSVAKCCILIKGRVNEYNNSLKPWLFLEEEEPESGLLGRVTLSEPRTQNRFPFSSIHRKTMYSTLCVCVLHCCDPFAVSLGQKLPQDTDT